MKWMISHIFTFEIHCKYLCDDRRIAKPVVLISSEDFSSVLEFIIIQY